MLSTKPSKKKKAPHVPNKCIGLLPYLPTNKIEARSNPPVINLPVPNFDLPYLRALCATTFSPIFLKPDHFASKGIYLCISPYTSMLFTTFNLYAFNPQLKSCNFILDTFEVNQLKNFEGRVFEIGSWRIFFHPLTIS